jgi:predicted esterase
MKLSTLVLLFFSSTLVAKEEFKAVDVYNHCKTMGTLLERGLKECMQNVVNSIKINDKLAGEEAQKNMDEFYKAKEMSQEISENSSFFGPLPSLAINSKLVTVMGFGTGAYEAHNLHITASDVFKGAGLLNGYCYSQKTIIKKECPKSGEQLEMYKKYLYYDC